MNKSLLVVSLAVSCFTAGIASAQVVHDWRDLRKAEIKIHQTADEVTRAAQANGFDMNGHAGRAVQLLHQAEFEVHAAVASAAANTTP